MKKYSQYKNSDIEWLGEIPKEWNVKKLKWMSSIKRGASPRPIDDPKYFDEDGEYAWVRIADVSSAGMFLEKTTQRMSELGTSLSVKREPGDIFLSIAGTVGKPCITKIKCCIHDGFVYFPEYKGDIKYLYYIFDSGEPYKGLGKMGTQLNLNTETVGSIQIPDISIEEQQKISSYLDSKVEEVDALINSKEILINLLEQQRQSIITEAVTKGLNPNVKMKDSGIEWIGETPELWDATKIVYYSKLLTGGTPDKDNSFYWENGDINWMASGEVNKEFVYEVNSKITELGMRNSAAKVLPVNSVMMALNGQGKTKGKVAVLKTETTCNQSLAAFVCNEDKLHYLYLYYYLKSKYKEIRGLVGDGLRDGISLGLLKSLRVPLPPVKEQQEIANYLYNYDVEINKLIRKNEDSIKLLKEYRQSLIYEAVTGKIDVCELKLD